MFDLTPSERRGAIVVVLLVVLGGLWDLTHRAPGRTPALAERPVETAGTPAGGGTGAPASAPAGAAPVDLNSAGAAEFDRLPGIGPVLARRIVEQREAQGGFRTADELLAVHGIGPRLFERLRPLVTVKPRGRAAARDTVRNAGLPRG